MFLTVTQKLLEGFGVNIYIFVITLLFAIPLGIIIAMGSMCKFKPISFLTRVFVWIIRGTPLMLQLIIFMYGPSLMFGYTGLSRMNSVFIAFTINYAAYFSEIYRGGVESIPKGQYEAGYALGMSKVQVFFRIIFMQVVHRIQNRFGLVQHKTVLTTMSCLCALLQNR